MVLQKLTLILTLTLTKVTNYLMEANRDAVGEILIFQFLIKLLTPCGQG